MVTGRKPQEASKHGWVPRGASAEDNVIEAFGSRWMGIPKPRADKERNDAGGAAAEEAAVHDWMAARRRLAGGGAAGIASRHPAEVPTPCWLDMSNLGVARRPQMMRGAAMEMQDSMYRQMHTYNPQEAYSYIPSSRSSSHDEGKMDGNHPYHTEDTDALRFESLYQEQEPMVVGFEAASGGGPERAAEARLEKELQELKRRLQKEQAKSAEAAAEAKRLQTALKETMRLVEIQPERLNAAVQHVMEIGWGNITWRRGYTALHLAAECGNADVMPLLVKLGADPSAKDSKGRTAADIAEAKSHPSCTEMLARLAESRDGGEGKQKPVRPS